MADSGFQSPLIDFFRRGEVGRDIRLLAAQGAFAPRAQEQIALLVLLSDDPDPEIKQATSETLQALPREPLRGFLARADTPPETVKFFAALGVEVPPGTPPPATPAELDEPLLDTLTELPPDPEPDPGPANAGPKPLATLSVLDRMKLAMRGTREQRSTLIRDSNKLVSAAVLSSPKVNQSEVEQFTKMGNVSEDVLRIIGMNRSWVKNYGVILGLCKNPKTPPALSMRLIQRLTEKDLKMLANDRNAKEVLRLMAKKLIVKSKHG